MDCSNTKRLGRAAAVLAVWLAASPEKAAAIAGGAPIGIAEAPWQLLLEVARNGGTAYCGASWIGGRWAVTAAHCLESATPGNTQVTAGITRRSEAKAVPSPRMAVKRLLPHPEYAANTAKDIAIVELDRDVDASAIGSGRAKPIRYATPADDAAGMTGAGKACMMTGWGAGNADESWLPDTLQKLSAQVVSSFFWDLLYDGTLRVFVQAPGKVAGACHGDSGGPLAIKDAAGAWTLAGVVAGNAGACGDTLFPSMMTRVAVFSEWIRQNTGLGTGVIARRADDPARFGHPAVLLGRPKELETAVFGLDGRAWKLSPRSARHLLIIRP